MKRVEITGKKKTWLRRRPAALAGLLLFSSQCRARYSRLDDAAVGATGKRAQKKLGLVSLDVTRAGTRNFQTRLRHVIQKGRSIKIAMKRARDRRRSVHGYVAAFKAAAALWKETEKGLTRSPDTLGRNRLAARLRPRRSLDNPRFMSAEPDRWRICASYIHAAFCWGMKSDNDYRKHLLGASGSVQPAQTSRTEPWSRAHAGSARRDFVQPTAGWNARHSCPHLIPRAGQLFLLTASASRRSRAAC